MAEVVAELGRDWHTVLRYGEALVHVPGGFENVRALELDEMLFVRRGANRMREFATSIADVEAGQLRDVVRRPSSKCQRPGAVAP